VAGSDESAEKASSVGFRFSAGLTWPIPPAASVFFISSTIIGAIAFKKANSSCVGIKLSAGTLFSEATLLWRSVLVVKQEVAPFFNRMIQQVNNQIQLP
jgi:hypothetical protein